MELPIIKFFLPDENLSPQDCEVLNNALFILSGERHPLEEVAALLRAIYQPGQSVRQLAVHAVVAEKMGGGVH